MKNKLLLITVSGIAALAQFGCVPVVPPQPVVTYTSRTTEAPVWKIGNPNVLNIPMLASHEMIGNSKVKGNSSIKMNEGNLDDAKALAVSDAISKVPGCDQLLNPIFSTLTQNDVITAEVTGYPIKLKNFWHIDIADTAFISKLIKMGVYSSNQYGVQPGNNYVIGNQTAVVPGSDNILKSNTQTVKIETPQEKKAEKLDKQVEGGLAFFNISDSDIGTQTGIFASGKFGVNDRLRLGASVGYLSKSYSFGGSVKTTYSTIPLLALMEFNLMGPGSFQPYLGIHAGLFSLSTTFEGSGFTSGESSNTYFGLAPVAGFTFNIGDRLLITAHGKYNYIASEGDAVKGIGGGIGAGYRF